MLLKATNFFTILVLEDSELGGGGGDIFLLCTFNDISENIPNNLCIKHFWSLSMTKHETKFYITLD